MGTHTNKFSWVGIAFALLPISALASEIVYIPVNPNFGGSPLNGPVLMSNAQAQDDHKDPDALGLNSQTPLEQFNEALQRSVLSRVASSITSTLIGPTGELLPGTLETQDFTILIQDLGGGVMRISTTDKVTGNSTSFEVSSDL